MAAKRKPKAKAAEPKKQAEPKPAKQAEPKPAKQAEPAKAESPPDVGQAEVQKRMDESTAKGFTGETPDEESNDRYTAPRGEEKS